LRFCGVAVLLCCSRKEVGGRRKNVKCERVRLREISAAVLLSCSAAVGQRVEFEGSMQ